MSRTAPATSLRLRTRPSGLSIVVGVLVGLATWEIAARIMALTTTQGDRVMPSLVAAVTDGLRGISDYWSGGLGVAATSGGGDQTLAGALLALGFNAGITLLRVLIGLSLSIVAGMGLGLLISAVRPVRHAVSGIAEMMRMLPALAMAPLFTLWFGAIDLTAVLFIVFGVAVVLIVSTANAVTNLAPHVTEYPRTLGVRGINLWLRVVAPAILPEMRGSLVFGGLVAWTSVLAGEMYGLTSGLGWMLNETLRFSLVDRMLIVAVLFSALALATMKALGAVVSHLTRWA